MTTARNFVRFLLAAYLWLHSLFLLDFQNVVIQRLATLLKLGSAETVVVVLLILFSVLVGKGFWSSVGNVAYIYFFPFILFFYLGYVFVHCCVAIARFITPTAVLPKQQTQITVVPETAPETQDQKDKIDAKAIWAALARPFTRFTFLWCLLVVLATNRAVLYIAVIVVAIHLMKSVAQAVVLILTASNLTSKLEDKIRTVADGWVAQLKAVTPDTQPTPELKNLWNTLTALQAGLRVLENEELVQRWGMLLCAVFLGVLHVYLAFVFSFIYCGVARLIHVAWPWGRSIVTSLFIPILIGDLPPYASMKLVGGLHAVLVLSAGASTLFKYFKDKMGTVRTFATVVNVRLSDEEIKQKYSILTSKIQEQTPVKNAK